MPVPDDDYLLSRTEVSKHFGIGKRFLELSDAAGTGPRRVLLGRSVRYRVADIRAWIDDLAVGGPEAQPGGTRL